ncbi:hypothetical protein H8356DRAFT_929894 [Neocallimastix lanati (nom. inval.)]|nr:hypothetical protein H8356DRAFT_929894 [Neocallimastix sp. JGI-2020a]
MSYINGILYLDEINIPGTHDRGTFDIGKILSNNIKNLIAQNMAISLWAINYRIIE